MSVRKDSHGFLATRSGTQQGQPSDISATPANASGALFACWKITPIELLDPNDITCARVVLMSMLRFLGGIVGWTARGKLVSCCREETMVTT
jgi:hypothetical protein